MYAFQLSFPFPGVVPAFLHIVQNRKILRSDLIIHFFWHQFQPAMFPALFFLNSLADCALKHISSLIQLKNRQQIRKRFKQRECSPASSQRFFSIWPCKLLSAYKRWIDRVWHRCRNEWHRPGLTQPALLPMTLHRQMVQKKVILLSAHTCTSSLNGLYVLKYQSPSNTWLLVESSTTLSMNAQNKTDAASTAQNTNKQATIYPCKPQSNYF